MNEDQYTIAKFFGPLHGVVLRQRGYRDCYTRSFNTRARDLDWTEGEYTGHYDMTLDDGIVDFCRRVRKSFGTLGGDFRLSQEKEDVAGICFTSRSSSIAQHISPGLSLEHTKTLLNLEVEARLRLATDILRFGLVDRADRRSDEADSDMELDS